MDKISKSHNTMIMNAGPDYGVQSAVQANEIVYGIYDQIQAGWDDVEYPELMYKKVLSQEQMITDINVGAQNFVYMIRDYRGVAGWQSQIVGRNIPRVGIQHGAGRVPLAASIVGAILTNEDARQYKMGFRSELAGDLQYVMQMACENFLEVTLMYGDASVNFRGFIEYGSSIAHATLAPHTDGGSDTEWLYKTGPEMVADVNQIIIDVYIHSNTLYCPDTIFMPPAQYALLSITPMVLGVGGAVAISQTALKFLLENNACNTYTGKQLKIVPIRYLKANGTAGADRMVAMEKSAKNQFMPYPMPYRPASPVPIPAGVELVAEMKHGPFSVKRPGSMEYADGI